MQVAAFFVMDTMQLTGKETAQVVGIGMMGMAMAALFAQLVIIPRTKASVRALLVIGILITMLGISLLLIPNMNGALFAVSLTLQGLGSGFMRPAVAAGGSLAVTPEEQGAVAGFNSSTAAVGFVFASGSDAVISLFTNGSVLGGFCSQRLDTADDAFKTARCDGSTDRHGKR